MKSLQYIGHFLTEISTWQSVLGLVDHVTTLLIDVQRTWCHLESIFIGSEDIRLQLPRDSQRFDEANKEFISMMGKMSENPNVILATKREGLADSLETIQSKVVVKCNGMLESGLFNTLHLPK